MTKTKKLFLFGLIIFAGLLFFSFAGKVSAQCTCYGNDPNTGDEYSYDCACEGGSFDSGDNIGGCTDQSCDNYDASATFDDGTCWNCGTVGGGDCACDVTFGCDEGCDCDAEIADCEGDGSSGGSGGVAVNCSDNMGEITACDGPYATQCYDNDWVAVACPASGGTGAGSCAATYDTCTSGGSSGYCVSSSGGGLVCATGFSQSCNGQMSGDSCTLGSSTGTCTAAGNFLDCVIAGGGGTYCQATYDTCTNSNGATGYCAADTSGRLACVTSFGTGCDQRMSGDACTGSAGSGVCTLSFGSNDTNNLECVRAGGTPTQGTTTRPPGTSGAVPGAGANGGASGGPSGGITMNGSIATINFANPLKATSVNQFLVMVLGSLQGIIAILSVIFIVIGGIMYITSAGNETAITRAKNTITAALVGLAIALAAPSFLAEIMTILGSNVPGPAAPTLRLIALRTLSFLLSVVGIIGIIGLVIGGYSYVTAYGSEKKIDTAKTIVKYSLIGIVVALAAVILVRQVATILGVV